MRYLSDEKNIIHRDLALRNLLVASSEKKGVKYTIKIAGDKDMNSTPPLLSRCVYQMKTIYAANSTRQ